MKTSDRKRDRLVSASLIVGALLAGLAALAAQRKPPAPRPAAAAPAPAASPPKVVPTSADKPAPPRPRVDVVFALDTTGSMSGLIEGAKRKIWSIASFVARAQPTPDLRVGLVAYRDVGDAYVTRVYDLDSDLDRVYRRLLSFRAEGGGDAPEHVAKALHEAVHAMSWSSNQQQADNAGSAPVRLIYLVGDAPPHLDYHDGYDYAKAARAAAQRGIQVHAIRCGTDPDTGTYWRRIASLGGGEFLTIDQDGGMRDRHTPYDEELARLHDELSETVVPFGRAAAEAEEAVKVGKAAAPAVKAARAEYMAAKKEAVGSGGDLVTAANSGLVDLDDAKDLPGDLAALPAPARKAKIAEKTRARGEILDRIATTSKKRDEYLSHDKSAGAGKGFDVEVENTVRQAGTAAGLKF
jgi:Mg-chelatase subunit ChlD